jgi:excisionase family DNA binding protein
MSERLSYRVPELAVALGVSRSQAYALVKSGHLPSLRLGGVILVPADAAREVINKLATTREESEMVAAAATNVRRPGRRTRR